MSPIKNLECNEVKGKKMKSYQPWAFFQKTILAIFGQLQHFVHFSQNFTLEMN